MENLSGEDSDHSEELKASSPERKEYMDSDGQIVDESINEFQSDKKSDILFTKSFMEGNAVVQPEPKQKEDKEDFQEPEVSTKSKKKTETFKRHVGETLYDTMICTACGQQVNHYEKNSIYRHPALNILICKNCYIYMTDDIKQ
ncbi:transcriptional regulator ATRX-like [Sminthopsis crassicaudata]|uniref:transcriptional regulator ATRX-like n=1 Tax=Sminthopsis crassicaudata TaxID=9301 RepID=UPI003D69F017